MHASNRLYRFFAAAMLLAAAVLAMPSTTWADGFSMPQVDISAKVGLDGSLNVVETRRFEFDEDVNGVFWTIPLGENQQGMATSLDVTGVSADDGAGTVEFSPVPSASNGDAGVYTVERSGSAETLKIYAPHDDGDAAQVTVRYSLHGAVMAWSDTAELYWQFVGPDWAEASENVTLTVTFDGAAADDVPDKDAFRAWGHGPLTATVTPDRENKTVSYTVPIVHNGEFAEARIAFPVAWVPGLAADSAVRMPTILSEEQQWADEANARREQARQTSQGMAVAQVGLPAVFLAVVGVCKLRQRKPKPVFQETYFRDVPSQDHPAVIAAFMRDGSVGDEAIVSTLMKLTDDRVVELKPTSREREERGLFGSKKSKDDYALRMTRTADGGVTDAIDRAALDMYFSGSSWRMGENAGDDEYRARTFSELQDYAKDYPNSYKDVHDEFEAQVKAMYEQRNLVASTGAGMKGVGIAIGSVLLLGSAMTLVVSDGAQANLIGLLVSLPLIIAAVVLCFTFKRYTQEGVELRTKCEALKKWLEDFTRLKEAVPGDLVLWNKLLVMAVALGVSEEVLRQLADAVPAEMREDVATGDYYYPVYWWCYPHHGMSSPTAALHTAYAASMSELASSLDSSGGGFGGGFSGGGGGGVGGGGGGTF